MDSPERIHILANHTENSPPPDQITKQAHITENLTADIDDEIIHCCWDTWTGANTHALKLEVHFPR